MNMRECYISPQEFEGFLRGFGDHGGHFDENWLYLCRLLSRHLGPYREWRWMVCRWNSQCLIFFLACHWVDFWKEIQAEYNLSGETVLERSENFTTNVSYKTLVGKEARRYVREYWVLRPALVDSLQFPPAGSHFNHCCKITNRRFWLYLTIGGARQATVSVPSGIQEGPLASL